LRLWGWLRPGLLLLLRLRTWRSLLLRLRGRLWSGLLLLRLWTRRSLLLRLCLPGLLLWLRLSLPHLRLALPHLRLWLSLPGLRTSRLRWSLHWPRPRVAANPRLRSRRATR
jgi:hypothetical protein